MYQRRQNPDRYEDYIPVHFTSDLKTSSRLRIITDSIRRTFEHASDIAEVVMNLTILDFSYGRLPEI